MSASTILKNAQRLRRETDEALRSPVPSVTKIKLLVNDLVGQIESLAVVIDRLEAESVTLRADLVSQFHEFEDRMRIKLRAKRDA